MKLEKIKELLECKNVNIRGLDTKEKKANYLKELSDVKNYQVLESLMGVGSAEKGTYSLSETLKIVKKDPTQNYYIIPIK